MDKSKVTVFNTKGERDEFLIAVRAFQRNMSLQIELQQAFAELRKASYDAHIKHGFTPEQALELCKDLKM